MDLDKYKELVPDTTLTDAQINAAIVKTQAMLEELLGFTLTTSDVNDNEYPDLVPTRAYRILPINKKDEAHRIDPCTEIYHIYLLLEDGTTELVNPDYYQAIADRGVISYISFNTGLWNGSTITLPCNCVLYCNHVSLLVDANWLWQSANDVPAGFYLVWADMITFYANPKEDIKSETLGSHSYTKFDRSDDLPEQDPFNASIIRRYAGPRGSAIPTLTV